MPSAKDLKAIEELIALIGGKNNIISVSHCLTRLRFVLNDPNIAEIDKIKQIPFVKGCFNNAGQFQVIIGVDVDHYYQILSKHLELETKSKDEVKSDAKKYEFLAKAYRKFGRNIRTTITYFNLWWFTFRFA